MYFLYCFTSKRCVVPSPLWACPAPRELYLRRQMELEHVLGRVSHPSNPVHTPGTLPAAPHGARSVISRLYQNIGAGFLLESENHDFEYALLISVMRRLVAPGGSCSGPDCRECFTHAVAITLNAAMHLPSARAPPTASAPRRTAQFGHPSIPARRHTPTQCEGQDQHQMRISLKMTPPTHTHSLRLQMCVTFKVIVLITAEWADTARWQWDMCERLTNLN